MLLVCAIAALATCVKVVAASSSISIETSFTSSPTSRTSSSMSATPGINMSDSMSHSERSLAPTASLSNATLTSSTPTQGSSVVSITQTSEQQPSSELSSASPLDKASSSSVFQNQTQPSNTFVQTTGMSVNNQSDSLTSSYLQTTNIQITLSKTVSEIPSSSIMSLTSPVIDIPSTNSVSITNSTISSTSTADYVTEISKHVQSVVVNTSTVDASTVRSDFVSNNTSVVRGSSAEDYISSELSTSTRLINQTAVDVHSIGSVSSETLTTTISTDSPMRTTFASSSPTASVIVSATLVSPSDGSFSLNSTAIYSIQSTQTSMPSTSFPTEISNMSIEPSAAIVNVTSSTNTIPVSNESATPSPKSMIISEFINSSADVTNLPTGETVTSNTKQTTGDSISLFPSGSVFSMTASNLMDSTTEQLVEGTTSYMHETVGISQSNTAHTSIVTSPLNTSTSRELSLTEVAESSFSFDRQTITTATSQSVVTSQIMNQTTSIRDTLVSSATQRVSPDVEISTSSTTVEDISTPPYDFSKHVTYRVMFTFDGDCGTLKENEVLREEFWKALIDIIITTTELESDHLEPEDMICDPIRIFLRINYNYNTTNMRTSTVFESLKNTVSSSGFDVLVIDGMRVLDFKAMNVEILEVISEGPEMAKTGLELTDIVIIGVASFLFAVLVLMMIIVLCRECYVRKRTTTFHLTEIPHVNLKLSDFTLTKIPRPRMFYRGNSLRKQEPLPMRKMRQFQNGQSSISSTDKVKVNMDDINVRMRDHEDGLVVGITCSDPPNPANDASSSSSSPISVDQSKRSLLNVAKHEDGMGVINPTFKTDGEVKRNSKIVIQDDENEQLL